MNVSFQSLEEKMVTFLAAATAAAGKPGKISANNTVDVCGEGDLFCGVIAQVRGGVAGVITGGYVELPYTGTTAPTLGYCALSANGTGGVQADTDGRQYLVTMLDTTGKTIGLFL